MLVPRKDTVFNVYYDTKALRISRFFQFFYGYFEINSIDDGSYKKTDFFVETLPSIPTKFSFPKYNISGEISVSYNSSLYEFGRNIFKRKDLWDILCIHIRIFNNTQISISEFFRILDKITDERCAAFKRDRIIIQGYRNFPGYSRRIFSSHYGVELLNILESEYIQSNYLKGIYSPMIPMIKSIVNSDLQRSKLTMPGINLLLYGESGTGKSLIITEITKYTKRHILLFDVNVLSPSKLHNSVTRPKIYINNGYTRLQPRDFIIVLENIDEILNNIKNTSSSIDNRVGIKDILELFNPKIPIISRMIIATTRNIEKVPEGILERVNSVHIEYVSSYTFKEILSKEYPHIQEPDYITLPEDHTIPTSRIMECIRTSENYPDFCSRMGILS